MRRVQALAGAAVLPVLLATACSDRPNDLYTYYDDASPAAETTSSAAAAPRPAPSVAVTTTARRQSDPASAALTAIDLAAEEVQPDGAHQTAVLTALPDCAAPLPAASSAVGSTWRYPSGSVLRQYVAVHQADVAPVVASLSAALDCGAFTVEGLRYEINTATKITAPGAEAQHSWCATNPRRSTCSLALAAGDVLSIVTVEASTLARAQAAIGRLAPVAGGKLTTD